MFLLRAGWLKELTHNIQFLLELERGLFGFMGLPPRKAFVILPRGTPSHLAIGSVTRGMGLEDLRRWVSSGPRREHRRGSGDNTDELGLLVLRTQGNSCRGLRSQRNTVDEHRALCEYGP